MAQRPLNQEYVQANLPANLPENWINDNYLMADDIANPEYGYNYLNKQINNTQNALKAVNSYFDEMGSHVSCYSNYPTTTSVASYSAFNYISSTTGTSSVLIPGSAISIPNPFGTADREIKVIANVQCYTREDDADINWEDCNTSVYMFNRLDIGDGKNGAISSCGTYALSMHTDGYGTGTAHVVMSGTSTGEFPVCLYYQRGRGQNGSDQSAIMGFSMIVIQTKL